MTKEKEFGRIRNTIWPIHNFELKKFIPLSLMFLLAILNYAVLRVMKDVFVQKAAGTEAISFIKMYGVTPAAILFTLLYSKLSNVFSKERLFNVMLSVFIIFFALFVFVLYPNMEYIQLNGIAESISGSYPKLKSVAEALRFWPLSLFFIMSELWGAMCVGVLFWTFANDITKVSESKRFYGLLGIGAQLGLAAGAFIQLYATLKAANAIEAGLDVYQANLSMVRMLISIVIVSGLLMLIIKNIMNKNIKKEPELYNQIKDESKTKGKTAKPKLSIKESFMYLIKSKYLGYIALLVMFYGVSTVLVEQRWKAAVANVYIGEVAMTSFYAKYQLAMSFFTIFMMLFFSSNLMRKSWTMAAVITPIMSGIFSAIFFTFVYLSLGSEYVAAEGWLNPVYMSVFSGLIYVVMSKGSKYSLFDPTKEAAYIPLDQEAKVKGKAAIEVIGSRVGKGGAAFIISTILLPIFGTLADMTIPLAIMVGIIIVLWIFVDIKLGKEYNKITAGKE